MVGRSVFVVLAVAAVVFVGIIVWAVAAAISDVLSKRQDKRDEVAQLAADLAEDHVAGVDSGRLGDDSFRSRVGELSDAEFSRFEQEYRKRFEALSEQDANAHWRTEQLEELFSRDRAVSDARRELRG